MQEDLMAQMGYMTLASRLKRISDSMSHSARNMYKTLDMDIEPNWYLVLKLCEETENKSVMELASNLGFTHQSVLAITEKMVAKKYLKKTKDQNDKRKTIFNLTDKAKRNLPEIEKIWATGKRVIYELLQEDISIIQHLNILESNLQESSFGDRILKKLKSI